MKSILLASLMILLSCNCVDIRTRTIGVQGIGDVDQSIIINLKKTIEEVYDFENVVILESRPLPPSAFVNIKSPRYRADSILRILKREKPESFDYVIGIIEKDISSTKRDPKGNILKPESRYTDWGVFGLGYRPGPSCVISTYRIKSPDEGLFQERLKKICMHEIGHNLGLKHCTQSDKCVMRDAAETIKTIDKVALKLCNHCQSLLN